MKKTIPRQATHLARPDLSPFAGLFLLLSGLLLLASNLRMPEKRLVSLAQTPYSCHACFNVPAHTQIYVCLATDGRISFAVADPGLWRAIVAQVGEKYGVHYSPANTELTSAEPIASVAAKPQSRPALLTSTRPGFTVFAHQEGISSLGLTPAQVLDCVATTRMRSPGLTKRPACLYLAIDAQTKASLVMRLINALQKRKISRLYLLTHCDS